MSITLKTGYTFSFENQTWKITESYFIKWNDGTESNEYKVKAENGITRFLEIEKDTSGNKSYSFWAKIYDKDFIYKSQNADADFIQIGNAKFPKKVNLQGINYEFDERNDGICKSTFESEEVNSLDYANENGSKLLSIELWDDEIEVSLGRPIKEIAIKNIEKKSPLLDGPIIFTWITKYIALIIVFCFFVINALLNSCNRKNSWNSDNSTYNDSTKVHRSNNYYRNRSGGFGK